MDPSGETNYQDLVDINSASAEQLAALEGVGPALAERIVADRAAAGPYARVDDLVRVQGIEPALLERLRPWLTVSAPEAPLPGEGLAVVEPGPDERLLEAEDEEALEAELLAYGQLPLSEEELPSLPEEGAQAREEEPMAEYEAESEANIAADARQGEAALKAVEPETGEPGPPEEAAPAEAQAAKTKGRFWHHALLVLLGGLLGTALTLLVLVSFTGTLDYAPRQLVLALSRNMDTMQANQETTWDRLNGAIGQLGELEGRITRLEGLADRVAELEDEAAANAEQLVTLGTAMDELETNLTTFETQMAQLDGRVTLAEEELTALGDSVDAVQTAVADLRERVSQFDSFIQALRKLLAELDSQTSEQGQ